MKLYGVYNANGGLLGKLYYGAGKILGSANCALCDVTHGHIREKATYKALIKELPVSMTHLHLNEQPECLETFTKGKTPCVVLCKEGRYVMVFDKKMLTSFRGNVTHFHQALKKFLESFP